MRVGILGGTFDPVHLGHLLIAEEARARLGLEETLFIPTGKPWLRAHERVSDGRHRLAMVELATASNPYFRVSAMEIERPGVTYTIDTLRALCAERPDWTDLYFILGLDAFERFHLWREPLAILDLCRVAVFRRPGHASDVMERMAERLGPVVYERVAMVDGLEVGISATDIRRRVASGESIRYRTPDAVRRYIECHGLYRDTEELA